MNLTLGNGEELYSICRSNEEYIVDSYSAGNLEDGKDSAIGHLVPASMLVGPGTTSEEVHHYTLEVTLDANGQDGIRIWIMTLDTNYNR